MLAKIGPAFKSWEASKSAHLILLKGSGKAFCGGGDVASLAKAVASPETRHEAVDFFKSEYETDNFIAKMKTPLVSFWHGATMGGGVGLSVHGPFRIATETTVFAMPETRIGLFPDVAANFMLSRLDGQIGLYLGLTSEYLKGYDVFQAGIATHFVKSDRLPALEDRLAQLSSTTESISRSKRLDLINQAIEEFTEAPSKQMLEGYPLQGTKRTAIDHCFNHDSVDAIIQDLDAIVEGSLFAGKNLETWAAETRKTIEERSPTSCKVALWALQKAATQNIDQVFASDMRLAAAFSNTDVTTDFVNGVEYRLVDKEKRTIRPPWKPNTLKETTTDFIRKNFFKPTEAYDVPELSAEGSVEPYTTYPHASYTLPSEAFIRSFVVGEHKSSGSFALARQDLIKAIIKQYDNKVGVAEKIAEVLDRRTSERKNGTLEWK